MMSEAVLAAHARLLDRYLAAVRLVSDALPLTEHDPERPSPCEVGAPDAEGHVLWRPVRRDPPADLAQVEREAGVALSAPVRALLGAWWCLPIEATFAGETLVLLGLGAPADEEGFAAQLKGHLAARRGRGEADTVPIAALFDGRFLSVDNATGRVWLESSERGVGVVSPSLVALLDALVPLAL